MEWDYRKIFGFILSLIAMFMMIGGTLGYVIMGSTPEALENVKDLQRSIQSNELNIEERIQNAEYDNEVNFATGAEAAEARKAYSSSIEDFGIGSVYIPTGNMTMPLLAGTSEWNLFNGLSTGRPDQTLGQGLYVGLSHNLINQTLIKRIDQMDVGDVIYLTDFKDVYTYQTLVQEVVHETDPGYFRELDENERPKLLLYRCEGTTGTEWRRIVYAEFVDKKPLGQVDDEILEGLNIDVEIIEEAETEEESIVEEDFEESEYDESEVIHESKGVLGKIKDFLIRILTRFDWVSNLFLNIYKIADNHPILFAGVFLLLIILYVIL